LAFVLTVVFVYGYFNYHNKQRVEINLTINKPINPLKIVAISDLHLGYNIGKAELDEWIKFINLEKPDLVLIAGDIIDNHIEGVVKKKISFDKIKSRYGVYACLGNHEYIGSSSKITQSLDFIKDAKITVLRDTALLINNEFYLIGRDDRTNSKRKSLPELLQTLDTTKPFILLDHQPFNLYDTEKNGIDLQVSGHTHSGQLMPFSWIINLMYENPHGYLRKGNSHIYVSSGIGIWGGKFRIGTRSEYTVINLTQKLNTQSKSLSHLSQCGNNQNAKITTCHNVATAKTPRLPLATTWQQLKRKDCHLPQCGNDQNAKIATCHNVATAKTQRLPLAITRQQLKHRIYPSPQHDAPLETGFLVLATKVASLLQPFIRIIKSDKVFQNI
jgi:predicted MPP superfamily phosphohydrolase